MNTRLWRWTLAGLIYSGFVFTLSGCVLPTQPTDVRNLPDEVREKLSIGDTRQKVRSVLGDPLIDAQSLGVEVYSQSGRDYLRIVPLSIPLPLPSDNKVSSFTLVTYDKNEIVKDIATDVWISLRGHGLGNNFWINAGEFSFVNIGLREPSTLLGPSKYWQELEGMVVPEGSCSLVLLMGKCPMEQVSLDADQIVDLKEVHSSCGYVENWLECSNNLCGTFIQKIISSGVHHLEILQESPIPDAKFETVFECVSGETIYAELEGVDFIPNVWHGHFEGAISIRKSNPNNVIEMGNLRPIIWHQDKWYVPLNNSGAYGR